ncbi:MAG TPA: hypothetical protein DCS93_32840 [Microscillaceae bacterium]|nr:hypothetical protein [Microscillaceae bacterium]
MKLFTQKSWYVGLLCLILSIPAVAQAHLTYTLEPHLQAQKPYLQISFSAKTNAQGILNLHYNDNFWGERNLFHCLQNITTQPSAQTIDRQPTKDNVQITGKPNTRYQITYHIVQDKKGPIEHKHCLRPIVQRTYLHSFGHRLFLLPLGALSSEEAQPFTIRWRNIPRDFVVHHSFGSAPNQTIQVKEQELFSSIFVAGDFKRYVSTIEGNQVHFLVRGQWEKFNTDQVADLLKKVIRVQRDFWQDHRDSLYTVTLMELHTPYGSSVGGTNLHQSFATYCSKNKYTTFDRIKYLYNHELLHNWVGKKIINADEERQYWFSEGFTDYYTYKLMLKSGLIDLEGYLKMINQRVLKPHYTSKIKTAPNDSLTYKNYWGNYAYQKLPYYRGALYALLLDTQIKQKTKQRKSLDNLMFDLLKVCSGQKSRRLDHSLFKKYLRRYLGKKSGQAFERFIEKGQLIDFKGKLWKEIVINNQDGYPQFALSDQTMATRLKQKLIK